MENVLTKFDNYKRTWSVKAELPVEFVLKYSSDVFDINNPPAPVCSLTLGGQIKNVSLSSVV
jgi:hypothetical protein